MVVTRHATESLARMHARTRSRARRARTGSVCMRAPNFSVHASAACVCVRVEFLVRVSAFDVLKVPPEITADLQAHSDALWACRSAVIST